MAKFEHRIMEFEEIARLRTRSVQESLGKSLWIERLDVGIAKYSGLYLQPLGAESRDNFAGDVPVPEPRQVGIAV